MLLGLDDTIQLQSEALWERHRQRRVNANVTLAGKVIRATSHTYKPGKSNLGHIFFILKHICFAMFPPGVNTTPTF